QVNWYAAIAFCNKLSLATGKNPVYYINGVNWAALTYSGIPHVNNDDWDAVTVVPGADGYRLPTEAEWMWAAMGADTDSPGQLNTTGYGKAFAGSNGANNIGDYAWYIDNCGSAGTHQVGKKNANELGLYDMSGNVWELTYDWKNFYTTGTLVDPTGPTGPVSSGSSDSGRYRMVRGGSWINTSAYCTIAIRVSISPGSGDMNTGFRVVRTAP
ncbi:MAG: formylglycine-generating enzyme family protein, partial [Spirochaetaceae bacterium]|nr:formylglycine-generating enzyme family protein [Spirochaetaceae bacterium]